VAGTFRVAGSARDLALARYGLREVPVDPAHLQLGPDGSSLGIWGDRERTIRELSRFSVKDARTWRELSETIDAVMPTILAYMHGHPTRVLSYDLIKSLAGTARRPGKLAPMLHFMTASQ